MEKKEKPIRLYTRFINSYRKNSFAVFFSFMLTFLLLTAILSLIHTNSKIANIQAQTEFSPADCYIDELAMEQVKQLEEDPDIKWMSIQYAKSRLYDRNGQKAHLTEGDSETITMMSGVLAGRLPEAENEVVAEKWVLLNLGIEPVLGEDVELVNEKGETETFRLTGILTDIYGNKKYGLLSIYTFMEFRDTEKYLTYIQFEDGIDFDKKIDSIREKLGLEKKQIKESPIREDMAALYMIDAEIIGVILLICMVVFYGVYRIATLSRLQQYGILRAVGLKKGELRKNLLLELLMIYLCGVPAGILSGLGCAYLVMALSGDRSMEVYLLNKVVEFQLVIPVWEILLCVVITAVLIGAVAYFVGRRVANLPVMEAISGNPDKQTEKKSRFNLSRAGSKTAMLFQMSCKYIFRDLKTSSFAILTICLGVTLFTGLLYKAETLAVYRADTEEMYYLNGEYAMSMLYFDRIDQGVSRESLQTIRELDLIDEIKTSSGLPIRVIDEDGVVRNEEYYDERNTKMEEFYGYCDAGHDGKEQVYKSLLCGYNENALRELEKYVIEGEFDPAHIAEDEIILSVLRMDAKNPKVPGSYKEGTPLMEYHAGDTLTVKYREDLQTDSLEYEEFSDEEAVYQYRTFQIAAIVSFPYMFDCNKTVYPLLITGDSYIKNISPESRFQNIYLDGKQNMSQSEQMELERKLIRIGSSNNNVSTRSLISEIRQNEMFYRKQMVYIYGIAVIAFLLVMINMVNNLRYRMQTRTREICMLRAAGLSVSMARRMIIFENLVLGSLAVVTACVLSQPVLRYLYVLSDMKAFGHSFGFPYVGFIGIAVCALTVCVVLSAGIPKEWKTKQIVEGIKTLE